MYMLCKYISVQKLKPKPRNKANKILFADTNYQRNIVMNLDVNLQNTPTTTYRHDDCSYFIALCYSYTKMNYLARY